MELWWSKATKDVVHSEDGGSFITGAPPRGLLHSTEGSSYSGARSVYVNQGVPPHFTHSYENNKFQSWQHYPINRAARALENRPGGVQTNRQNCIQAEIVGFAVDMPKMPQGFIDGLSEWMRWVETQLNMPSVAVKIWLPYPQSYGLDNGVRMAFKQWNEFTGWCGHQHAPEQNHGDPGAIPIQKLLDRSEEEQEDEMDAGKAQWWHEDSGTEWAVSGSSIFELTSVAQRKGFQNAGLLSKDIVYVKTNTQKAILKQLQKGSK